MRRAAGARGAQQTRGRALGAGGRAGRWASARAGQAGVGAGGARARQAGARAATRPCRLQHGQPRLQHGRAKGHDTATVRA